LTLHITGVVIDFDYKIKPSVSIERNGTPLGNTQGKFALSLKIWDGIS